MRSLLIHLFLSILSAALLFTISVLSMSCAQPINLDDIEATHEYPYLEEPLRVAWRHAAALNYYPDEEVDYWQSPHETEARGGGDCEDVATVLVYHLGREASRVKVYKRETGTYHSVVLYRGRYLEAGAQGVYWDPSKIKVIKVYPYDVVMKASTHRSTK